MTYLTEEKVLGRKVRTGTTWLWVHAPLGVALLLRVASVPSANLGYLVLAAYALLGRACAIRALAASWLFTMLNPAILPEMSGAPVERYAVLFAAAASALLHSGLFTNHLRIRPSTLGVILLGAFLIGHSFLFSPLLGISILKALSWTLAMATLVSAWTGLNPEERQQLENQLFWGLVLILLVSLPLAATSLGYLRNGTGFQGILNHPQAFGPAMGLLGVWSIGRMLTERQPGWWLIGLIGACAVLVLMSEARTAGFAIAGGVLLAVLLARSFIGRPFAHIAPGLRSSRIWAVLFVALIGGLAMAPKVVHTLQSYTTKSGRAHVGGILEAYERSRGHLIDAMLNNISRYPLTGIGFGVASEPALTVVGEATILGLPTSAPVEKGVAPLAVMEEIGLPGAALVAFWMLFLLRSAARGGLAPFVVCLTALLLNMGEATLFSPGGFGLLSLILFGWAHASGVMKRSPRHG